MRIGETGVNPRPLAFLLGVGASLAGERPRGRSKRMRKENSISYSATFAAFISTAGAGSFIKDRIAGRMNSAARRTQMLPAHATKPRLKIPLWFDIINVPKPIVVVNAARMTPLPVLKRRRP